MFHFVEDLHIADYHQSPFCFFKLPAELRTKVYGFLGYHTQRRDYRFHPQGGEFFSPWGVAFRHDNASYNRPPGLLRSCKTCWKEGMAISCENHIFGFTFAGSPMTCLTERRWMALSNRADLSRIRTMNIGIFLHNNRVQQIMSLFRLEIFPSATFRFEIDRVQSQRGPIIERLFNPDTFRGRDVTYFRMHKVRPGRRL